MERLTKKIKGESGDFYEISDEFQPSSEDECIDDLSEKLGKLEDIEERMDCPLEIMLQVFRKGIYVKNEYTDYKIEYWYPQEIKVIDAGSQWDVCKIGRQNKYVASFNYKKSWALTKEELE